MKPNYHDGFSLAQSERLVVHLHSARGEVRRTSGSSSSIIDRWMILTGDGWSTNFPGEVRVANLCQTCNRSHTSSNWKNEWDEHGPSEITAREKPPSIGSIGYIAATKVLSERNLNSFLMHPWCTVRFFAFPNPIDMRVATVCRFIKTEINYN